MLLGIKRKSKDKEVNARGIKLGKFTFVGGSGSSVIEYSLVGSDWSDHMVDMKIDNVPYLDMDEKIKASSLTHLGLPTITLGRTFSHHDDTDCRK